MLYFNKFVNVYHKILLPNYGVFDEKRYFKEGNKLEIFFLFDKKIAVNIYEDIWDIIDVWIEYKRTREIDAIRVRPHPYEFYLYFDI